MQTDACYEDGIYGMNTLGLGLLCSPRHLHTVNCFVILLTVVFPVIIKYKYTVML